MTRIIPARIEDGRIVPESPLPPAADVLRVSIRVETVEPGSQAEKGAALDRLRAMFKGAVFPDDPEEEYRRYLEEKYR